MLRAEKPSRAVTAARSRSPPFPKKLPSNLPSVAGKSFDSADTRRRATLNNPTMTRVNDGKKGDSLLCCGLRSSIYNRE